MCGDKTFRCEHNRAQAVQDPASRRCPTIALWILCGSLAHTCVATQLQAENWPQWRGPRGNGVSRESSVPVFWSEEREIAWKCPLPEWGDSTPAIWDDSVFVTSHTNDGRLLLLHIGARSGAILWTQQVGSDAAPRGDVQRKRQQFHAWHNLATPSPVTNGKVVIVHFGNGDLAAYDFNGGQLWKRNLQADYGPYTIWYGHANSPVIFDDMVISVCLQDSLADLQDKPVESYVAAHDLATGRRRWKTPRMTGRGRGSRRLHHAIAGERRWATATRGDGRKPVGCVRSSHRPATLVPARISGWSHCHQSDGAGQHDHGHPG